MKMTQKELDIILDQHELWLDSFYSKGQKADFTGQDVSGLDFSNRNLFLAKFKNGNCAGANFTKAYCVNAYFKGSNCKAANFEGSNCKGVNFKGSNCKGVNFKGGDFWGAVGNDKQIKSPQIGLYWIAYTKDILQIGCKKYTFKEWLSFGDSEIDNMADGALKWWKKNKKPLFKIIEQDPAED